MEWKEDKYLVKSVIEEKKKLDSIAILFKNLDDNNLSDQQMLLLEKHVALENLINACLGALNNREQKLIKLSYFEGLTNYNLSEALNISERTAATYKRDATVKFAQMIKFYLGLLNE